ncbi:MAG: type II secretion system protein [Clostridia bacterium]|nr:type II secretion system protein [Clostridia bacterium]
MTKIQKLRKNNKKGFTLVELLVVLVIIAILAAAVVPSMLGFIDKAKDESVSAECRNVLLAADVQLNEAYGLGIVEDGIQDETFIAGVAQIADVEGIINSVTVESKNGHPYISAINYTTTGGSIYVYNSVTGGWSKA